MRCSCTWMRAPSAACCCPRKQRRRASRRRRPIAWPAESSMPNEDLRLPEDRAKLPLLPVPGAGEIPEDLRRAWTNYMVEGFRQNQVMFDKTLKGFTNPYWLT